MLSDKKKNTEDSYTLDELETEINSLSDNDGKTVTFVNLDSSNRQHIEVYQAAKSWSQNGDKDLIIQAKYPTLHFYIQSSEGYIPGTLDHESPIDLSTLTGNITISASTGSLNISDGRQLVDMSKYMKNNPSAVVDHRFTNTTKEYFKSVKPTSLNNAFYYIYIDPSEFTYLNLLDTSECTDFSHFVWFFPDETSSILNLSALNTKNGINFNECILPHNESGRYDYIIDISSWDTSKATNLTNFLTSEVMNGTLTLKGIIDMSSATNYTLLVNNVVAKYISEPIKLKNVPSDFDYKKAGFVSEDQFQILSHR